MGNTIQINIGIVELEEYNLRIKRGSFLPIDVKKTDNRVTVKNAGVAKQLAHNKQLRDDECGEWVLLYEKYKEALGRPYNRVNLFICKMLDYESKNQCISLSK